MHINSPLNLNMDDKQVHADDVKSTHSTATTNVTLLSMNESDLHCVEHYLSSSKNKGWKNKGLDGIWTHDLCNIHAVLYQLS